MASEEDRLDQLLKAARQQLGEEPEEETAEQADDQSDRDASMPSFKEIAREFEEAEMEDAITDAVSGLDEVSLDEVTSGTQAIPEPADPNAKMSDDDIAALFAAMGNDDAPAEEQQTEPEAAPVAEASDPNAKMSDDDIAALFAAMGNDDAPAEEQQTEPEAAPVAEASDPNAKMSQDDIAALLAAMGDDEPPAVETVPPMEEPDPIENNVTQPQEDSAYNMSQAEIEAMLASNGGEDIIIGGGNENYEAGPSAGDGLGDMGLDELEKQLAAAEAGAMEDDGEKLDDEAEFDQIMANLGEDDIDLSDIGDMIEKSDSGELVDPSIAQEKDTDVPGMGDDDDGEEEEEGGKKKKRVKKKREKKKKEKPEGEAAEKKEKKPGFFSKLLGALFTEEEEEEASAVPEADATKLSDENAAILSEIDAEKDKGKGKKEKKKKEKKPKPEKPKKEKKPKPVKAKKPEEPDNSKRIPKKYISRTVILSASILIALLVVGTVLPGLMNMSNARKAYYDHDYKTAFLTMYGKDLNESDKKIYQRSRLLVMLDRKYESYQQYQAMGMEHEALDALLQGLARYQELEEEAKILGIDTEALGIKLKITDALASVYGIGEAEALETLSYSQADYTGKIDAVIGGRTYRPMKEEIFEEYGLSIQEQEAAPEEGDGGEDELPDLLPEEREYLDGQGSEENAPVELPAESPSEILYFQDGNVNIQIESDQF